MVGEAQHRPQTQKQSTELLTGARAPSRSLEEGPKLFSYEGEEKWVIRKKKKKKNELEGRDHVQNDANIESMWW